MHNSHLVGCKKSIEMISKIFIQLVRIQDNLKKYPTYYSKVHLKQEFGPLENTAMSWMQDFFSKHGECFPNRDTIHIPNNFSR